MDLRDLAPVVRKAVLIGGHDEHSDEPSDGVVNDLAAWRSHLTSSLGGNWYDSEIHEVTNGKKEDIAAELNWAKRSDISLLCFSGHGYLHKNEDGVIVTKMMISDNLVLSERDLNVGTRWCMAIMDCCRRFPTQPEGSTEDLLLKEFCKRSDQNTRLMYERAFRKCEYGFVKVYSADENEAAGDEISFTRELIKMANNSIGNSANGILNIRDAVKLVGTVFYGSGIDEQQHPVYRGGRRLGHFPFAVRSVPLHG